MKKHFTRGTVLRAPTDGSRVVTFRASTPTVDRHGTIIMPEGIKTDQFDKNPVFLWGHDGYGGWSGGPSMSSVIGRVTAHKKSAAAFDVDVEFAPAEASPDADKALRLVKSGFLSAVSIGFNPLKWHDQATESGAPTRVFDEVDLLEISLVPIPSNPDAVALTRHLWGKSVDLDDLGAVDTILRASKVLSARNKEKLRLATQCMNDALAHVGEVMATADKPMDDDDDEMPMHEKSIKTDFNVALDPKTLSGLEAREVRLHGGGRSFAISLIRAGSYDADSDWEFSAEDGNELLGAKGDDWDTFGKHHLGRETEASRETKDAWKYPFAKLVDGGTILYRSALTAIRQRAGQQGADTIFDAAGSLLEVLDAKIEEDDRAVARAAEAAIIEAVVVQAVAKELKSIKEK